MCDEEASVTDSQPAAAPAVATAPSGAIPSGVDNETPAQSAAAGLVRGAATGGAAAPKAAAASHPATMSTPAATPAVTDDVVISSLLARRMALATTLSNRLTHLRLLELKWRDGDVAGAVTHLEQLSQMVQSSRSSGSGPPYGKSASPIGSSGSSDRILMFGVMTDFLGRVQLKECNQQMNLELASLSRCWVASSSRPQRNCWRAHARRQCNAADLRRGQPHYPTSANESKASEAENIPSRSTQLLSRRAVVAADASSDLLELFGELIQRERLAPWSDRVDMNREQRQKRSVTSPATFASEWLPASRLFC